MVVTKVTPIRLVPKEAPEETGSEETETVLSNFAVETRLRAAAGAAPTHVICAMARSTFSEKGQERLSTYYLATGMSRFELLGFLRQLQADIESESYDVTTPTIA